MVAKFVESIRAEERPVHLRPLLLCHGTLIQKRGVSVKIRCNREQEHLLLGPIDLQWIQARPGHEIAQILRSSL